MIIEVWPWTVFLILSKSKELCALESSYHHSCLERFQVSPHVYITFLPAHRDIVNDYLYVLLYNIYTCVFLKFVYAPDLCSVYSLHWYISKSTSFIMIYDIWYRYVTLASAKLRNFLSVCHCTACDTSSCCEFRLRMLHLKISPGWNIWRS